VKRNQRLGAKKTLIYRQNAAQSKGHPSAGKYITNEMYTDIVNNNLKPHQRIKTKIAVVTPAIIVNYAAMKGFIFTSKNMNLSSRITSCYLKFTSKITSF